MKSFINVLADYRETPLEKDVTLCCPEEHILSQMKHLTRGFKKTQPADVLAKGDVAVLALESGLEKFNKPSVFVTVGGGLFDREFEEKLVGHSAGETFETTVGEQTVTVTVKQASRTVFPEPTDEMAAAYAAQHDEFAGITTVEEYRGRVVDSYLEDRHRQTLFGAMDETLGYVLTHSDWEFDEEEIAELISEEKGFINEQLKEENVGKELDGLTDEEIKRYLGAPSREELDKEIQNGAEQRIATALWMASVNGKDAKTASLNELEEETDWSFLENFVKENLNIKEER